MNLAAASGEDLATTSDIVTDALAAFGLTAADSGHFADILAAASSNANTNVSMMGETFKYCAPIAGALGFSAKDTAEAIGLMGNAGIKSTQAGTALRTIMSNLSGEVKICGSSIGEVTIATTNADGSMRDLSAILADCRTAFGGLSESEKAATAEALVGKNAMSGFLALMNAAPADIEKVSSAIANCDGKSAEMAATMQDNLAGQLTILKSQLQELAISFGEILMPAIRQIVTWIQGFVISMKHLNIPYQYCHQTGTIIHMAVGGKYAGHIVISDIIKPHSKAAIAELKKAGVDKTVMLTGDAKKVANQVASSLGIDEVYSELLPADKVDKVEELLRVKLGKAKLAFVGDGINDAPVLSRADIGIAMGAMGSDAAIEAADIVLMDDDPIKIAKAIKISRKCLRIVYQNIVMALVVKFACLALGAVGIANMYLAIFADVGVMILAVLNAIRCLFVKKL